MFTTPGSRTLSVAIDWDSLPTAPAAAAPTAAATPAAAAATAAAPAGPRKVWAVFLRLVVN